MTDLEQQLHEPSPRTQTPQPQAAPRGALTPLRVASVTLRGGLFFVALLVGLAITGALVVTAPKPERSASAVSLPVVRVQPMRRAVVPRVFVGYGTARAMDQADVSAQVSGRIVRRDAVIEAGAGVRQGDVLVEIETVDFEAAAEAERQRVAATEAELEALDIEAASIDEQIGLMLEELDVEQRLLRRASDAMEQGGGSGIEVETRTAVVRRMERGVAEMRQRQRLIPTRRAALLAQRTSHRAALRLAEENLARCTVRAPISGTLQQVMAEPGELMMMGAPIARVVDLSRIEIPLRVGLSAARHIAVGDPVTLRADSPEPESWTGSVVRIAPESDASTRTIEVFVEVRQPDPGPAQLRPGQFVVAQIQARDEEPRWVVPRRAVDADELTLAIPQSETAVVERARVRISHFVEAQLPGADPTETQWAVVEEWLSDRDPATASVVVSNLDELAPGDRVVPSAEQPQ